MLKKGITGAFIMCLTALLFAGDVSLDGYIVHTVRSGESISLLCIDIYGYYSNELGAAFQKDNQQVKNINLIVVGQKLKFREPRIAQATKPTPKQTAKSPSVNQVPQSVQVSDPSDSLFVKKVNATQGVVTCVVGGVSVYRNGTKKAEKLSVNTIVYPGDIIETSASGRVEMIINRETVVRLREKTRMTVESFRNSGDDQGKTKVAFSLGTVWTKMKRFKDKISRFELELPTAVAGVHGTVYQSTVNADSSSEVKVFTGEVAVQGSAPKNAGPVEAQLDEVAGPSEVQGPQEVDMETWTRIVTSMQKISISKKGQATDPSSFTKSTISDWEKWNVERDKRIAEMFMETEE